MNYYSYTKDIFFDAAGNQIPSINDIASWYLMTNKKYHSFCFNRYSTNCKILYKCIKHYKENGKIKRSIYPVIDFLAEGFYYKFFARENEGTYIRIYYPDVINGIGIYTNLLKNDGTIIETVFTNKKGNLDAEAENYYRVKLGLEYYLLGIEKDYGYVAHCSFKTAIRTILIENVYTHEQCKRIIEHYFETHLSKRKADIKVSDIIKYHAINDITKQPLLTCDI